VLACSLVIILLPTAFDLPRRKTLGIWLQFTVLGTATIIYLIGTAPPPPPSEWTLLVIAEASLDELTSGAAVCFLIAVSPPISVVFVSHLLRKSVPHGLRLTNLGRVLVVVVGLLLAAIALATIGLHSDWNRASQRHRPPDRLFDSKRDIPLLVLGQTCCFGSFSIHGYQRATPPRLVAQPGLLAF